MGPHGVGPFWAGSLQGPGSIQGPGSGPVRSRRAVLLGAAGLGAAALTGAGLPAHASLTLDPDPVTAYELAWDRVDTSVPHNEAGGLAWGISYILLSLVRMYQATGDTRYLDRFVERADQVWAQTDVRRGVTDWAGRSGWVWRAGGNYTAAASVITDTAGTPLFEVRYASTYASESTVTVTAASAGGADLVLENPHTGSFPVPGVSFDPSSPDFVVVRINTEIYQPGRRWTAKWLDGDAAAVPAEGTVPAAQRYYAFAVHTGMVTYPMALFARVVLQQQLVRYRGAARRYRLWSEKAVAFHDAEWQWRTLPDGSTGGDYVWPKGAPVPFDGLTQPFNQSHGPGLTMAELYRTRPGDGRDRYGYRAKIEAMVRAFGSEMEERGAAWQWHYWPTYSELGRGYQADEQLSEYTPWYGSVTSYEDISHAAISVEFLMAAYRAGVAATDDDAAHLAATYRDQVANGPDQVFTRVDGSTPATDSMAAQAGRWLTLQPWWSGMAGHVGSVYQAMELEPGFGSHLAGVGYLAWAANEGWRLD